MLRAFRVLGVLIVFYVTGAAHAKPVASFDDIELWAGSGANRAAVAIDWFEGSTDDKALVWGYRWDGAATGEDMLRAVTAADPRLFLKAQDWGWGWTVSGIGYDNGDGIFTLDDGTAFDTDGIATTASSADGGVAISPGDIYAEGWFLGFWHYGVSNGNPYAGGGWSSSNWGMSARELADGDWDSWAYTPSFNFTAFAENPHAAPVPEPAFASMLLAAVSAFAFTFARRRPRAAGTMIAIVGCLFSWNAAPALASPFATEVISYTPGVPHGVGNPAPYQTDGSQALGSPSHDTAFGSQVGVFYPAFWTDELVIIGAGGELTVKFDRPVLNDPNNPYGFDFLVFGNAFFVRNAQTGAASGLFAEPGRISVSQDNVVWHEIPDVFADDLYPTLGYTDTVYSGFGNSGGTTLTDFTKPVDPTFHAIGKTEAEINAGYAGSGGGTGVDIGLAGLDWIQYVKVWQPETDTWSTEIDAFAIVSPVPEPSGLLLILSAASTAALTLHRRKARPRQDAAVR